MGHASSQQRDEHCPANGAPTSAAAASPPAVPDEWTAEPDPEATMVYAVPHTVVSQIVRPAVAAFLPPDAVRMKTLQDVQRCVTKMSLYYAFKDPASFTFAAGLPALSAISASYLRGNINGISKLTKLRKLSLEHCDGVNRRFISEHLAQLHNLRELALIGCPTGLGAQAFEVIARLPLLEVLAIPACEGVRCTIDGEHFEELSQLPRLRELDLYGFTFADGMRGIANLMQLEALTIGACRGVSMEDFARLRDLKQLRALSLQWYPAPITRAHASHISAIEALEDLDLGFCSGVDAAVLQQLSQSTALQVLKLDACSGINTKGLVFASEGLTSLRELSLCWCSHVDATALESISKLPALEALRLQSCEHVDAEGLQHVSSMRKLTSLDIHGCRGVCDDVLGRLGGMPQLRRLYVDTTRVVSDEAIAALPKSIRVSRGHDGSV